MIEWQDMIDGGKKCTHDAGDYDGALVTEARVVQGGNNLWTPNLSQFSKGLKKKSGIGRIAGKLVVHYYPGQQQTREQAMMLCEQKWRELFYKNP